MKTNFHCHCPFYICCSCLLMVRLSSISKVLLCTAAILAFYVLTVQILSPSSFELPETEENRVILKQSDVQLLASHESKLETIDVVSTVKTIVSRSFKCDEIASTIDDYRSKSMVRAVLVRFPSSKARYYFVQFRWFYRSWIESETFTSDKWRTDLIVFIDGEFPKSTSDSLEKLNCRVENQRIDRHQNSRCILIKHKFFSERSSSERNFYFERYSSLDDIKKFDDKTDRLFAMHDFTSQISRTHPKLYDIIMVTTMNTFLTTQFGKYIPIKCSFLIGKMPDYTTWYGKTDDVLLFMDKLWMTLRVGKKDNDIHAVIEYESAIELLKDNLLFLSDQVDIPCDSTKTTYRTSIFHLKCYDHSTSLFSERIFRENAYDGYEKAPFNIFVAREYATLMALQSKIMSLEALESLAANVTHRSIKN